MDPIRVTHNETDGQFEVRSGEETAVLAYVLTEKVITFTHTEVPKAMEGKGIGSALAKAGLQFARANGLKVIPQCSFISSYIERKPEYQDLLSS